MTTVHEELAAAVLAEVLEDEDSTRVLDDTVRKFRSGNYSRRYVAWIGQTTRDPGYWPRAQVAAYLRIHASLNTGEYAMFTVGTHGKPGPDADREGNAAKLANLKHPFVADLDLAQNAADQDGSFSWTADVRGCKSTGLPAIHGCESTAVVMPYRIYRATAPLEVGSTLPSRTLMHLRVEGSVAHWPYGERRLAVIVETDRNWRPSQPTATDTGS